MNRRPVALVGAIVAVLLTASSCAPSGDGSSAAPVAASADRSSGTPAAIELTIYAAASLRDAMGAIEAAYGTAAPGISLTIATDSSATLRAQIEQGAPADVFLSADLRNPQTLVEAGFADEAVVNVASSALTIVVPAGNPAGITGPADLASPGVKVVAAADRVPISGYAREVVNRLSELDGYPADFVAGYHANIVSREENVKAVLAKVELGEADAAIVYLTDARSSDLVQRIEIPPEANVSAVYGGVVVKATRQPAAAHRFLSWLTGSEGAAILATFGFERPE